MLKSRFPEIIRNLDRQVDAALRTGAHLIEAGAKDRVPVAEGNLRAAIHVERDAEQVYRVQAGDSDVFYGHLVEHGTVNTPPKPFLVPAAEAGKGEVVQLVTAALRRL